MSDFVSLLVGVATGVAGTYLFTHPENRAVLLSRIASFGRQELAWIKPVVAKLFRRS